MLVDEEKRIMSWSAAVAMVLVTLCILFPRGAAGGTPTQDQRYYEAQVNAITYSRGCNPLLEGERGRGERMWARGMGKLLGEDEAATLLMIVNEELRKQGVDTYLAKDRAASGRTEDQQREICIEMIGQARLRVVEMEVEIGLFY